ncbi:hypothetical protein DL96DRAFT_1464868 [Flagelloscypha sp. PMI_526]|nr:hypothetical protein DL96DRAFT_1464868 [Flagelloscypha sp. PMI_526]
MPLPSLTRFSRPETPTSTPGRPSASELHSPPGSYAPLTPSMLGRGAGQKSTIVTKLAIVGKAGRKYEDSATVRMYLKVALPLDGETASQKFSLFPEEKIRQLRWEIHPLDQNGVPYAFSSQSQPLIQRAAKELKLPSASSLSFYAACGIQAPGSTYAPSSFSGSKTYSSQIAGPVDEKYTGAIIVADYCIAYVAPGSFPQRKHDSDSSSPPSRTKRRRSSIGERNTAQFLIALSFDLPFMSKPPRYPYLLSIPTPKCLHNHIRFKIPPPISAAASFQSLSSQEGESGSWDISMEPSLLRTQPRTSSHFADDETSDSQSTDATAYAESPGLEGTFKTTNYVRLRWAKPVRAIPPEDGRPRAGVNKVNGEMTCEIIGKRLDTKTGMEGVIMRIEYTATCKDIWYSGTASLLGLDGNLQAPGSDVSWDQVEPSWEVSGGTGFTGFSHGQHRQDHFRPSRHSSLDSTSSESNALGSGSAARSLSRHNSHSTSSLLRAPLPSQNVPDYSFESSVPSLGGTVSSFGDSMPSSMAQSSVVATPDPTSTITINLNISELISPSRPVPFTFTLSGIICVTPKPSFKRLGGRRHDSSYPARESDSDSMPPDQLEPITLPRFTLQAADAEETTIIVRNEMEDSSIVEVYNSTGDVYRDPQAKKTVLQKSGYTKCGPDGGRIVVRPVASVPTPRTPRRTTSQVHIPRSSSQLTSPSVVKRPPREGPPVLTHVDATITPLRIPSDSSDLIKAYSVHLTLPAPANADSEWLEFGLSQDEEVIPSVDIFNACIDGVPVPVESAVHHRKPGTGDKKDGDVLLGQMKEKRWKLWVRVKTLGIDGTVVVDYLTRLPGSDTSTKGKSRVLNGDDLDILLPSFSVPVNCLTVHLPMKAENGRSSNLYCLIYY